jgi:CRP-like cAMP-binding protein
MENSIATGYDKEKSKVIPLEKSEFVALSLQVILLKGDKGDGFIFIVSGSGLACRS